MSFIWKIFCGVLLNNEDKNNNSLKLSELCVLRGVGKLIKSFKWDNEFLIMIII